MIHRNRALPSYVLGLASLALLAMAFFFSYQAGCAADLKISTGDVQAALHLGDFFAIFLFSGLALSLVSILSMPKWSLAVRTSIAFASLLVLTPASWLLALEFEASAVHACGAA